MAQTKQQKFSCEKLAGHLFICIRAADIDEAFSGIFAKFIFYGAAMFDQILFPLFSDLCHVSIVLSMDFYQKLHIRANPILSDRLQDLLPGKWCLRC